MKVFVLLEWRIYPFELHHYLSGLQAKYNAFIYFVNRINKAYHSPLRIFFNSFSIA